MSDSSVATIYMRPWWAGRATYCGLVIAGATLLLWPAILSGFPLIFPDTSDYIILTPRLYRSPFYQLWVFLTGWKWTLWLPIFAQGALVSAVCVVFLRQELKVSFGRTAAVLAFICVATSLPFTTSFVMPDVFTGLSLLCFYLLVFRWGDLDRLTRAFLLASAAITVSAHLSHITITVATVLICVTLLRCVTRVRPYRTGAVAAMGVVALSGGVTLAYNRAVHHRLSLGPAGSTFLMANLIAEGPARRELHETCPSSGYLLCDHLAEVGGSADSMLWDDGIIMRMGGFPVFADDASRLDKATLLHRPGEVVAASLGSTMRALGTANPTFEIAPTGSYVDRLIGAVYGRQARQQYLDGRQSSGSFPRHAFTILNYAVLALALVTIALHILARRTRSMPFVIYACVGYLCDAAVCATLSGVHDRYQSRVSWLLVMAAVAILFSRRHVEEPAAAPTGSLTT